MRSSGKLKLQQVTVDQWGAANIRIMYKLIRNGTLKHPTAYYSTPLVFEMCRNYDWQSILLYDQHYRNMQANYNFKWGSEEYTHLIPIVLRPSQPQFAKTDKGRNIKKSLGREVCLKFNSAGGCNFTACKFAHMCSEPGCSATHSRLHHNPDTTRASTQRESN